MQSVARTGVTLIALAFPVYLLWKGRLPLYMAMAKAGA